MRKGFYNVYLLMLSAVVTGFVFLAARSLTV